MTDELLHRARAGERAAFTDLVEPYRREVQVHCYRMLGSLQDAEDAVQETLLAAWLGLDGFEGRSSVRTWLYRIATNRCLNAVRSSSRRPVSAPVAEPTGLGEVSWLQPYPDFLLEGIPTTAPGPEARYESQEAISLAFVTAVQLLPPQQRAVLLLRDVLGFRAAETAEILNTTVDAVNSALKRARSALPDTRSAGGSPVEDALVARFVAAFTADDVDGLVALMTDDAWLSMPPLPFEYRGRAAVGRFFASIVDHRRDLVRMVPIQANGQPGWGEYARDRVTGTLHLTGLLVARFRGELVAELTHFETVVAPYFGLPRTLP